ncbi:MAG TPA: HEAT repeat domain-containing protein [Planctomycetes bacterium]|nr:HEAT repeat domain-containing protein [Planctomycetaceae bacterium]HIM31073.1 HEAT repeat domain-containing protein [Planctomycetota bacterium]
MKVQSIRSPFVLTSICLLVLSGCAEYAWLNPMIQLERHRDSQFVTPFHERLDEIHRVGLAAAADQYTPDEQTMMASELTAIISEDSNPVLRASATRALGHFESSLASTGIGLAMADDDAEVRISATEACGDQFDEQALQRLIALLRDDSTDVQISAIKTLADFPHPTTIVALGEFLDHDDPALQVLAVKSLKQNSGKDFGNNLDLWKKFIQGGDPVEPPKGAFSIRGSEFF